MTQHPTSVHTVHRQLVSVVGVVLYLFFSFFFFCWLRKSGLGAGGGGGGGEMAGFSNFGSLRVTPSSSGLLKKNQNPKSF